MPDTLSLTLHVHAQHDLCTTMSSMTWRARCAEQGAAVAALKKCQEGEERSRARSQERRFDGGVVCVAELLRRKADSQGIWETLHVPLANYKASIKAPSASTGGQYNNSCDRAEVSRR